MRHLWLKHLLFIVLNFLTLKHSGSLLIWMNGGSCSSVCIQNSNTYSLQCWALWNINTTMERLKNQTNYKILTDASANQSISKHSWQLRCVDIRQIFITWGWVISIRPIASDLFNEAITNAACVFFKPDFYFATRRTANVLPLWLHTEKQEATCGGLGER